METLGQVLPMLPEIVLAFFALALLLGGVLNGDKIAGPLCRLGAFALLGIVAVMAAYGLSGGYEIAKPVGNGMLLADGYSAVMKIMALSAAAVALILAPDFLSKAGVSRIEYPVLVCLAALGMMLMLSAHNFLMLYVGLELQSLALYVLAAFQRDTVRSSEAGLKYFVLGALSSGFLLYGISMLYGYCGSVDFVQVADMLQRGGGNAMKLAVLLVLVALAFKIAAAPFHMWTPDVYEGAPTPVTAFFAVAPKVAAFGLLMRVLLVPFAPLTADWQTILIVLSLASMAIGAFGALGQSNLKRLLAYSSIGHVGFLLMGVAAAGEVGVEATIVYLAFYVIMSLAAFAVLLQMRRGGDLVETIPDLAGVSRRQPLLAMVMAAVMFSMAGVPPLVGFFTKVYVLAAAAQAGLMGLAVAGVLLSVVSAFYYLKVVKVMYFDEPAAPFETPAAPDVSGVMVACGLLTALGLFLVSPIALLASYAAHNLFLK